MAARNQADQDGQTPRRLEPGWRLRKPAVVIGLIVAGGVAGSLGVAMWVEHDLRHTAHARFERRVERLATTARNQLEGSVLLLEAGRTAIESASVPPGQAIREFAETLDVGNARTPVRTLEYMSTDQLAARGDPAVRAALSRATASQQTGLAVPAVGVVQPQEGALLLVLPVRAPRASPPVSAGRREPSGFLLASVDPARLFEPAGISEQGIDMRLVAGSPPVTVYEASRGAEDVPAPQHAFDASRTFSFGGTPLTFVFAANRDAATGAAGPVALILVAGLAATVLSTLACYWASRRANGATGASDEVLNEARMMSVVRASSDAVITIDDAQRIVIFNPMAERVFGVSAMEAIGTTLDRFIPQRYREAHTKHVEQFGITGVSDRQMGRQRVLFGVRANGEEFPLEASISQIRDRMGKLYTVVLRDVTERVRAENALRQSREELADLSANLQKVREEEKTRIARELHDDLGQQLTALKMDLSAAERALRPANPDAPVDRHAAAQALRLLDGMRRLIDSTVASLRRIAADLRPVMLDDLGLLAAIDWLTNDFTQRYGIPAERRIDAGQTSFTREAATAIFRIVQEALNNVARHADATVVRVSLTTTGDHCLLKVEDDGRGAPADERRAQANPNAGTPRTFGLIGIRERARLLGGTVTIDTAKDHGFALTISFPLRAVQQEETLP
ncbi:PAS domain S-box protein [Paraburkholderia rhizosphaerae]|uniref:histidine kinase n=1 Tax=Paraburkholderia rhizosphaerae TaxID=480658 RepID=A0A4R8LVU6_9BURK|nr:PAS domain S-box protein [Paraburkholderia rhizosphaerae]TDY50965.1 PAS domain S-box-containing protein [Paraburkholderia rhizosphaerae]